MQLWNAFKIDGSLSKKERNSQSLKLRTLPTWFTFGEAVEGSLDHAPTAAVEFRDSINLPGGSLTLKQHAATVVRNRLLLHLRSFTTSDGGAPRRQRWYMQVLIPFPVERAVNAAVSHVRLIYSLSLGFCPCRDFADVSDNSVMQGPFRQDAGCSLSWACSCTGRVRTCEH